MHPAIYSLDIPRLCPSIFGTPTACGQEVVTFKVLDGCISLLRNPVSLLERPFTGEALAATRVSQSILLNVAFHSHCR